MPSGQKRRAVQLVFAVLASALAVFCALASGGTAFGPAPPAKQIGKVLSVQKILRNRPYYIARYSPIHGFDVYFLLSIADQNYCAEYKTTVLDETEDLESCKGKDVEVSLDKNGKKIAVYTLHHRKLTARMVEESKCFSKSLDPRGGR